MAEQTSDTELLALFRDPATKDKAFTEIVKKYQERLYWHIRRMLVNHDDSNDAMQNVFIRVWNALAGFREDAQLYTWLYRIATNECLTYLEQQKKKASISLSEVESGLSNKIRADKDFDANNRDPLFEDAARLIVQNQIGSTSLIQRRMKLGYNRAGRLMDQLEAAGVVGPNQGSKAREVIIKTDSELSVYLTQLGGGHANHF